MSSSIKRDTDYKNNERNSLENKKLSKPSLENKLENTPGSIKKNNSSSTKKFKVNDSYQIVKQTKL